MTLDQPSDLMPTLEGEIRRFESDRFAWLPFATRVEARYQHETAPLRTRALLGRGLFSLLVYDLFLVGDYFVAPGHILRSIIVRLGIFTPVALITAWFALSRRGLVFRDAACGVLCLVASLSVLYLHHDVDAVVAVEAEMGVMVILIVMNCLLRLEVLYAGAVTVVLAAINVVWLAAHTDMTTSQRLVAGGMLGWVMVLALAANYTMARERRYAYLLHMRGRMQHNMLAEANADLLAISSTDRLTGLPNRHAYESRLEDLWEMTRQNGSPFSAVMVDVDHFKTLNDTYGHPYGDRVLQRVASLLQQAMRLENDFVARYGGEEFIVLLPSADQASALKVAERIRTLVQVAGSPALQRDTYSTDVWATVSCGVATVVPNKSNSAARLIADADAAMYRAKQEGRNRVCYAPSSQAASRLTVFPGAAGRA